VTSPPGYRIAALASHRAGERRFGRQLLAFATLVGITTLCAANELAFRQPRAYLDPGAGLPWWIAPIAAAVGALGGGLFAVRIAHPGRALPWLLLLAAVPTAASGYGWFAAFARPGALDAAAIGVPLVGCALVAASLGAALRALRYRAAAVGIFERATAPGFAIAATVALGVAVGGLTRVGLLRAGALLGITLATLALWATTLLGAAERHAVPRVVPRARALRAAAIIALVGGLVALHQSGRWVALADLRSRDGTILYTFRSPQAHYVVTSAQASYALFVDGRLELSTLDGYRYAEALVHPAMAAALRHERVSVLGGGTGLIERELLRYPEVQGVEIVTPDPALPRLAKRAPWVDRSTRDALATRAFSIVVEEPIVWLDASGPQYDVILVNVPDPVSYGEAKNYSQYFYARLGARLGPGGVAVAQATSPLRFPETFQTILATARSAGLHVLPYRAPLATLGEWGFLLLSRRPLVPPRAVPDGLAFLDGPTLLAMFAAPPDTTSKRAVSPNRLYSMSLLDAFERETTAVGALAGDSMKP